MLSCPEISQESAGEKSLEPSGDPQCLYCNKAVTCGHFQMEAILWAQKGKNKPAPKAENNSRKDTAEQGVCVSRGGTKLRSFKWIRGESIGRRKYSLISKKG